MRRILSILLLVLFALPLVAPMLAAVSRGESGLPACCRRAGKHHCMGNMQVSPVSQAKPVFRAPQERCPYAPGFLPGLHHDLFITTPVVVSTLLPRSLEERVAETESKYRISRDRSRQTRGPPVRLIRQA